MDTSTEQQLLKWVEDACALNPDKGYRTAAKEFCEMNDIVFDEPSLSKLLLAHFVL